MVYTITYDLNAPGKNYDDLYEKIKSLGAWAHYMDSTWFVDTNYLAEQIRDILIKVMDSNDSLFVSKITSYSGWLQKDAWTWLSEHIKD